MNRMEPYLIVMRLADMQRRHPAQDDSRFCSHCQHRVGIYPSGQAVLKQESGMKILCSVCNDRIGKNAWSVSMLAPGALDERKESYDRNDSRARRH
jgi:hypothetical protein